VPIRIAIVDDHALVPHGLKRLFDGESEFDVVHCCGNGPDAIAAARTGTNRRAAARHQDARDEWHRRVAPARVRARDVRHDLSLSEGTVKIHLHNVYEKLGLDGRLELMLHAQKHGLA